MGEKQTENTRNDAPQWRTDAQANTHTNKQAKKTKTKCSACSKAKCPISVAALTSC
jgi:hypothetical protein